MLTVFGLESLSPGWSESTVCIGVFDGVHLGHQALIRAAASDARLNGRPCVALTFDRHPMSVLRPKFAPQTVLPLHARVEKIRPCGADVLVIARFDHEFASIEADRFIEEVLKSQLKAASVVVGHDFAFGKDRGGDVEFLRTRIPTEVMQPFEKSGRRVSSTEVRKAIASGHVSDAAELLGGDFCLYGVVVRGNRLGREIGIPTINLALATQQILPADGIYAGWAETEIGRFEAAISIGKRPTVDGAGFAIEAHLLEFPDVEIYGHCVALSFAHRIRDEEKFSSVEAMAEQMQRDVAEIKRVLRAMK
ncbi:MAG: bifunctional riboflavin kinase/FAD synthetase [Fimbriimonadales bacterium]|nr:bifunctional riboflavin kinase/FAD synthetase [Fimbriimonadales bacterium]